MAINLDPKIHVTEVVDSTKIFIKDITGTITNPNGFQDAGGTVNTNNPKITDVTSVKLTFTGTGLDGIIIELAGSDLVDYFDYHKGVELLPFQLLGSSVTKFPFGVYTVKAVYEGEFEAKEFTETEYFYIPLLSEIKDQIRSLSVNVPIPPQNSVPWFNNVINLGIINFLLIDIQYACELGLYDYAVLIADQLVDIMSNDGKIIENVII